ncbi:hypothetical protein [Umezawaea sp. NPDC059074]|uniref:hypothetical protein n=1 Tax=Umezawaea sp. NPDC059074 TaxID=3346716 RepID=UPI0036800A00
MNSDKHMFSALVPAASKRTQMPNQIGGPAGAAIPSILSSSSAAHLASVAKTTAEALPPRQGGMPVATLLGQVEESSVHYVVTTIDNKGRLADQSPLRALGWLPEAAISIAAARGAMVLVTRNNGPDTVTRQGHLRLPAPVRHSCRIKTGARLLVAALPEQDMLLIYPSSTVDAALLAYHQSLRDEVQR